MKKLIELYKCSNPWSSYGGVSTAVKVFASPIRTLTSLAPSTHNADSNLFSRLLPFVSPKDSIVPVLDQWVEQGGRIDPDYLSDTVELLRKGKRFVHCLQMVQWMSDKKIVNPSPYHVSAQLDLIYKVHGVGPAEAFFHSAPDKSVWHVYNALLNCYVKAKLLEKAEATMEKMKELGYAKSSAYNIMLSLYSHLGNQEKLDVLLQEMEENAIHFDKCTYAIKFRAYGASSDVEEIKTLLMKMEADPFVTMDWRAYTSAAGAFSRAGATDKALETLKKSEQLILGNKYEKLSAFESLMYQYGRMGKRYEVHRLWNLSQRVGRLNNSTYYFMINSLCKLDDLDGAEQILREWEAGVTYFDYRLPNYLITAYCKKGLMEKAELVVKRLIETGREPNASTWSRIAHGYLQANEMDKSVEVLKKEILVSTGTWKPHILTLGSCLKYLYRKGDVDAAEEIIKSLQEKDHYTGKDYEMLMKEITNGDQRSNAGSETGVAGECLEVDTTRSLESKNESIG